MKRIKFKNPFNGIDNAKKLIPESYKTDGHEFEMTDGNETYRLKWESSINEATALTSGNKSQINEDMRKMKHLMGFKSQDTLGTVKGAARLDENKKFNDILGKSKGLIKEYQTEYDQDAELEKKNGYDDDEEDNSSWAVKWEPILRHSLGDAGRVAKELGAYDWFEDTFKYSMTKMAKAKAPYEDALDNFTHRSDLERDQGSITKRHSPAEHDEYKESKKAVKWLGSHFEHIFREEMGVIFRKDILERDNIDIDTAKKIHRTYVEATRRYESNNSLNEKELTDKQKKHIDLNNDGKITKNDFDIMNQNEVHIKEEEEELGALSKGAIGKKFKEYGNTISKADFKPKERIVTTQLLDIIKKLAGKSNAYSPAVIMKLEMLVKEIDKAIDSGGAAEGDEGAEDQKGFKVDEATFTDEYNDNDKLTGGQDELPDELQAAILGVDEANAIKPGTARSGMGGERGLKGSHLTKGESKGKPRNHALRQAGNDEIEKQLANMKPDEESEIERDLYKDRFDEVFEGMHEDDDIEEEVTESFYDNEEVGHEISQISTIKDLKVYKSADKARKLKKDPNFGIILIDSDEQMEYYFEPLGNGKIKYRGEEEYEDWG